MSTQISPTVDRTTDKQVESAAELTIDGQGESSVELSTDTGRELPSLPQVDTSRAAWAFVAAGFVEELLLWGPLFSSGVYLKHYATLPEFQSSTETTISLIGTLSLFFAYSAGLPLLYFYNRFPRYMKPTLWGGLVLLTVSTLAASFVKSMGLLILFQGIGPGIAAALCAFPIIRWVPEWFDKRKGVAIGVIFSGGGFGGVYMPLLNQYLIDRLGYQWSLRISAAYTAVLAGIAICFVNPRIPISARSQIRQMPMPGFFDTFLRYGFYGCFICTLLQAFGYFPLGLFLPRFTSSLGATEGAGLLAAFNVSCIAAQILWGYLTDRIKPATAMAISSLLGSVLALTLWGIGGGVGIAVLAPFSILFGLATGGFTSMWSQSAHAVAGPDREQQTMLVSGFCIARGIGAAVGPVIGAALYRLPSPSESRAWGAAGSPGLVALVAASLACSTIVSILFANGPEFVSRLKFLVRSSEKHGDEFELSQRTRQQAR